MTTLVWTIDYELFFGAKTGSVENCLVVPTQKLLEVFKRHNVSATFFFDILYYLRLKEIAAKDSAVQLDLRALETSVRDILTGRHEIQLHLHPHWLDATYENHRWKFPHYNRYKLHNLMENGNHGLDTIAGCVSEGKAAIEELCSRFRPGTKVTAFRAGGWCVEPFEKIGPALKASGILIDSSVASGYAASSSVHQLDFRGYPRADGWRFTQNPKQMAHAGAFIELPISTFHNSLRAKIMKRVERMLAPTEGLLKWGNGIGIPSEPPGILSRLMSSVTMMSFEDLTANEMIAGYNQLMRRGHSTVTTIGHVKNLSPFALREVDAFLTHVRRGDAVSVPVSQAAKRFN